MGTPAPGCKSPRRAKGCLRHWRIDRRPARWLAAGTQAGLVEEAVVEALGKIADKRAIPVLIAILEANYDYKCSSASGDLMRHHSKFVGIVVECLGKS